ncbi:HD domain-containing protein [Candidatus Woesearchaeota archaeon]|nr:HD domain-containing protein [Candidatus Woesearchaeota archaeon]
MSVSEEKLIYIKKSDKYLNHHSTTLSMKEINQFRIFNKLKTVNRFNSVGSRKESSAEHSWSCLILADFFLSKFSLKIDRLKVYELLMYHDVVEIEAGDSPLHPELKKLNKKDKEQKASELLKKELPQPLNNKFLRLFYEFEDQKTIESKFAKAIDALDAIIHELDYKDDWKTWSETFLVEHKLHFFEEFPELKDAFHAVLIFCKENNYFTSPSSIQL